MELLAAFTFEGDLRAGELYAHYGRCMKGRRQLVWSRGLRADLGLATEKTDQELAEETDQRGNFLAFIPCQQWQLLLADDVQAHLLALGASGDGVAVADFLAAYKPVEVGRKVKTWRVALDRSEAALEARRLGLSKREYLQWRWRGVTAIAEAVPCDQAATRSGSLVTGAASRKEVKPCCVKRDSKQAATFF